MSSEGPQDETRFPFRKSLAPEPSQGNASDQAAAVRNTHVRGGSNGDLNDSSSSGYNHSGTHTMDFFSDDKHTNYSSQLEPANPPHGLLGHHAHNQEDGMAAPAATHPHNAQNDAYGNYEERQEPEYTQNGYPVIRADTQDSLAAVRTISRIPDNDTYYEKNGLRTYGDGQDHMEHPMTFKRFMIFVAMGFLWTASQIPLYLYGGVVPIISSELDGGAKYVWLLLAYTIPLASITPFVGPLADLLGRRWVAVIGAALLIIGNIICATASNMNNFIGGMTFNGTGAGILELISLAVAGESAPTKKRGLYIGGIICTIFPYCPAVLYANLVAAHSSWRYLGLWCGLWAAVGLVLTLVFYHPPRRANRGGLTKREILKRIDFTGGLLAAGGLTLFLMALTWGGNQYAWGSTHVIPCLVIGGVLIIGYFVWEAFFVRYPMFPRRLGRNPRALTVILIITFVSGANFFSVLVFWPTQYAFVYTGSTASTDPVRVGIGSLPVGFCIIGGSIIFSALISIFKGKIKILMIISCIIMTAGTGAMAAARLDNLNGVYAALTFACLGVGAVIIPSQVISGIVCPDDLIASVTALTISVRFVGGAIAYAAYYNVIRNNFLTHLNPIAGAIIDAGIIDPGLAIDIVYALANNERQELLTYPDLMNNATARENIIRAGQEAFALSYPTAYYISIAFGGTAIIASLFLPDISQFMDNHVAVQYMKEPGARNEKEAGLNGASSGSSNDQSDAV